MDTIIYLFIYFVIRSVLLFSRSMHEDSVADKKHIPFWSSLIELARFNIHAQNKIE